MQSSSPTFSTLSTATVSIFSCKIIKRKDNSNTSITVLATKKKNPMTKVQILSQTLKLPYMGVDRRKKMN